MPRHLPKPVRGWHLLAPELFAPEVLAEILMDNSGWLRESPRSTRQIHNALFPDYDRAGMTRDEIYACIEGAMEEAGYSLMGAKPECRWSVDPLHLPAPSSLEDLW